MANLGRILGVSPQHIIIRTQEWDNKAKFPPKIGDTVFTIEKVRIGQISDIFGPVSKPFISVKCQGKVKLESFNDKKGESLFTFREVKKDIHNKKNKYKKRKVSSKPRTFNPKGGKSRPTKPR